MTETLVRPLRIFLAEDNRADVYLVELALREEQLSFILRLASDGEAALKVVAAFGETEPVPDIALLDLNLPRQDGNQVLRSLRRHPRCGCTPIVIMTSSDGVCYRDTAERYQAVFFSKRSDLTGFLELGRLVKRLCEQSRSASISA